MPAVSIEAELKPGAKLLHGRYTLVRQLGRGGMGAVWLVKDGELEADRALKFITRSVCEDEVELAALKREALRSQALTHKNIVRVHDFVREAALAAISMEYVDGPTLKRARAAQPLGVFEADGIAPWVAQMCEAFIYAHEEAGIVHHDLKPSNLMLNSLAQIKVADFGISQAFGASATSLSDSVIAAAGGQRRSGTPAYMSPQQAMGEDSSPQDDIYSLGATLHDLLTSRPPFYQGDILGQVLHKEPPSIGEARKALAVEGKPVPPEWEETVLACLEKRPGDRPGSVAEIADRLGLLEQTSVPRITAAVSLRAPAPDYETTSEFDATLPHVTTSVAPAPAKRGGSSWSLLIGAGAVFGLVAAAGIFFALTKASGGRQVVPDLAALRAKAAECLAAHDHQGALSCYMKLLEHLPEDADAHMGLAKVHDGLGNTKAYISELGQVIALDPGHAEARFARGVARAALGSFAGADDDFTSVIAAQPQNAQALRERGLVRVELDRFEDAADDLAKAISLGMGDADTYAARADALVALNRLPEAVDDLSAALEISPSDAGLWAQRALLRLNIDEPRDAAFDATKALEIDPEFADAFNTRGLANLRTGRLPEAIADFNEVIRLDPANAQAKTSVAQARRLLDRRRVAEANNQPPEPMPQPEKRTPATALRNLFKKFRK